MTSSTPPLRTRNLRDLYEATQEIIYDEKMDTNMLCLLLDHELLNFQEANENECWRIAMREEIQALEKNDT